MKVDIIPIGNSKGIRIPKAVLEQCGFGDSVELEIENNHLLLSSIAKNRDGWDDAFKAMAANCDDRLLDSSPTVFDESEWQW